MAEKLKKALGLVPLTFYGVGTIVGAGIYAIIGVVAGEAGYNMWIAFVLTTIAATFSALSYAELSSTFPKAGAEYVFLSNAFPNKKVIPFITGYFITIHGTLLSPQSLWPLQVTLVDLLIFQRCWLHMRYWL